MWFVFQLHEAADQSNLLHPVSYLVSLGLNSVQLQPVNMFVIALTLFSGKTSAQPDLLPLCSPDNSWLHTQLSAVNTVNAPTPALVIWVRHLLALSSLPLESVQFCMMASTKLAIVPYPSMHRLGALLKISPGCFKVGSLL